LNIYTIPPRLVKVPLDLGLGRGSGRGVEPLEGVRSFLEYRWRGGHLAVTESGYS